MPDQKPLGSVSTVGSPPLSLSSKADWLALGKTLGILAAVAVLNGLGQIIPTLNFGPTWTPVVDGVAVLLIHAALRFLTDTQKAVIPLLLVALGIATLGSCSAQSDCCCDQKLAEINANLDALLEAEGQPQPTPAPTFSAREVADALLESDAISTLIEQADYAASGINGMRGDLQVELKQLREVLNEARHEHAQYERQHAQWERLTKQGLCPCAK